MERLRGHRYHSPLAQMRAWLEAFEGARLAIADGAHPHPRMIAALGPRMLELAAELADGALPYLTLPEHTAQARQVLGPDKLLVVEAGAVLSGTRETWQRRATDHLDVYRGLVNYRNSWLRQGFSEADLDADGPGRLTSALVTHGLDATLARVREHLDAGADQVAVQVLGDSRGDAALADIEVLLAASGAIAG